MYNDDQNLYHYSYTSGDQPGQNYDQRGGSSYGYQSTPPAPEIGKPKKKHTGLKITALALCCALLGGAVGGGAMWALNRSSKVTTQVNVSQRPSAEVVVNTVDYHMNPQECLDAPRFQWVGEKKVQLEREVPAHIAQKLADMGHEVTIVNANLGMGRGEIIWRMDDGTLVGGTEPRADGTIAAW